MGGGARHVKFYPYEKGGSEKVFTMLNEGGGGSTTSFEEVLTRELEVLAIVMGGRKKCPPFKMGGGGQNVLPCLEGGARKVLDTRFSHFVAPLPVINDQSLKGLCRSNSISKSSAYYTKPRLPTPDGPDTEGKKHGS